MSSSIFMLNTAWKRVAIRSVPMSPDEKQQSQRLSSILLTLIITGIVLQLLIYIFVPPNPRASMVGGGVITIALLIPYFLSRAGFYNLAILLMIALVDLAIFVAMGSRGIVVLYYLLIPILISSVLMALHHAILIYLVNMAFMAVFFVRTNSVLATEIRDTAVFITFTSLVLLVIARHRNQVEQDNRGALEIRVAERTSDLLAANHSLNKQIAEREQAEAAEKQARQIKEILQNATLSLTQSLELDDVLNTLLTFLNQLIPYDSGNVMLRRGEQEIQIVAVRGYEPWIDPQQVRFLIFTMYHYL